MFVLKYRIIQVGFGIRLDLRRLPGPGSRVRSLILHEETGMSASSFSRTAAGDRAYWHPGSHVRLYPLITVLHDLWLRKRL